MATFNLCGNVCAEGRSSSATFASREARSADVSVVLLQEACRSQARSVAVALTGSDEPAHLAYVSTFRGDAAGANQCADDDYGIGIVSVPVIERTLDVPLPNPGLGKTQLDQRRMLCVDTSTVRKPVTVCGTHLVRAENDAVAHQQQVAAISSFALRHATEPIVIGGDFNAPAAAFSNLLIGDRPPFNEGAGTATDVDRLMASSRFFSIGNIARRHCTCSDHALLIVTMDRR